MSTMRSFPPDLPTLACVRLPQLLQQLAQAAQFSLEGVDQDQRNAGEHGYSVEHVHLMAGFSGWQAVAVSKPSAGHAPSAVKI